MPTHLPPGLGGAAQIPQETTETEKTRSRGRRRGGKSKDGNVNDAAAGSIEQESSSRQRLIVPCTMFLVSNVYIDGLFVI